MTGTTKTVRALSRGLQVLRVLNDINGASAAEIVRQARLPRTTVLRSLETLSAEGYVVRDPIDDLYRLTVKTRGLSYGFDDEAWVSDIARPLLFQASREVVWPLALSTLRGTRMLIRENTDRQSPLALQRLPGGFSFSILGSSAGLTYLAFAAPQERTALLPLLAKSSDPEDRLGRDLVALDLHFARIRAQGFGTTENDLPKESSFALPVLADGVAIAAISLRFISSALSPDDALERYFERMKKLAYDISSQLAEARARPI
jgi:IclR family mhp operon transcriptional activator